MIIKCVCVCVSDAGSVAGGVIGALVAVLVILGVLYYLFRVKGVKLSSVSLPNRKTNHVDVVSLISGFLDTSTTVNTIRVAKSQHFHLQLDSISTTTKRPETSTKTFLTPSRGGWLFSSIIRTRWEFFLTSSSFSFFSSPPSTTRTSPESRTHEAAEWAWLTVVQEAAKLQSRNQIVKF